MLQAGALTEIIRGELRLVWDHQREGDSRGLGVFGDVEDVMKVEWHCIGRWPRPHTPHLSDARKVQG